jgi:MFS family permease
MGAGGAVTFTVATFGPELTDEFGLSRVSLGLVPSVMYLAAMLGGRPLGRLVDRVGAVSVAAVMLVLTPVGVALIALATGYPMLLAGAVAGGLLLAASNPVTNSMLASRSDGSRGALMGLKQAGATMMSLYVGAVGPVLAVAFGWRAAALAMVAVVPFAALLLWPVRHQGRGRAPAVEDTMTVGVGGGTWVRWLSLYSVLLGIATANSNTYFVLYAKQALGFPALAAGSLIAVMGAAGIAGRIGWAAACGRRGVTSPILCWVAAIAAVATLLLLLAPTLGPAAMWIAVAISGLTVQGWNGVGMMTVVHLSAFSTIGATSGTVLFPFFAGLAVGPTVFGAVVDRVGDFAVGWGMQAVVLVAALFAAAALYRSIERSLAGAR